MREVSPATGCAFGDAFVCTSGGCCHRYKRLIQHILLILPPFLLCQGSGSPGCFVKLLCCRTSCNELQQHDARLLLPVLHTWSQHSCPYSFVLCPPTAGQKLFCLDSVWLQTLRAWQAAACALSTLSLLLACSLSLAVHALQGVCRH